MSLADSPPATPLQALSLDALVFPAVLAAAQQLYSSPAGVTMAVAQGESVANMPLQPFWALPALA